MSGHVVEIQPTKGRATHESERFASVCVFSRSWDLASNHPIDQHACRQETRTSHTQRLSLQAAPTNQPIQPAATSNNGELYLLSPTRARERRVHARVLWGGGGEEATERLLCRSSAFDHWSRDPRLFAFFVVARFRDSSEAKNPAVGGSETHSISGAEAA